MAEPEQAGVLRRFRDQIEAYTDKKEVEQIESEVWSGFVRDAKVQLSQELHSTKYATCDLGRFEESFGDNYLPTVVRRTAMDFARVLFETWCVFFLTERWSVAQALILLQQREQASSCSVRRLAQFMWSQRRKDERFKWVCRYTNPARFERAIRQHVRESKAGLAAFAFRLNGKTFHPVTARKTKTRGSPLAVRVRLRQMFAVLSKRLCVMPTCEERTAITDGLLMHRTE